MGTLATEITGCHPLICPSERGIRWCSGRWVGGMNPKWLLLRFFSEMQHAKRVMGEQNLDLVFQRPPDFTEQPQPFQNHWG